MRSAVYEANQTAIGVPTIINVSAETATHITDGTMYVYAVTLSRCHNNGYVTLDFYRGLLVSSDFIVRVHSGTILIK